MKINCNSLCVVQYFARERNVCKIRVREDRTLRVKNKHMRNRTRLMFIIYVNSARHFCFIYVISKNALQTCYQSPKHPLRSIITFVHASIAVLEDRQFVDLPKLLEERFEVLLLEIARDLSYKELDGILVFHGAVVGVDGDGLGAVHGLGEGDVRVLGLVRDQEQWCRCLARYRPRSGEEQAGVGRMRMLLVLLLRMLLASRFSLGESSHSARGGERDDNNNIHTHAHALGESTRSAGNATLAFYSMRVTLAPPDT